MTDIIKYVTAKKVGRCFNGAHRDAGTIVHLVPAKKEGCSGDWFAKALCGTEPGRRGNGWSATDNITTCEKCITKQSQS